MNKISAVIFDLNGIFIKGEKLSERFHRDFGISQEIFVSELLPIMDQVRKPQAIKAFDYWRPVLAKWNIQFKEEDWWNYWFSAEPENDGMIKYAGELKSKGLRLFLLSNNFRERSIYYGHYPWLNGIFEKVYYSWQTGFVKPDVRAWELVLSENALKPEECAYFDDQEKNIKAASSLGINAYLATEEKEIRNFLQNV